MSEELIKKVNPFKPIGIAKRLAEAENRTPEAEINPADRTNRLVLIFDDSGSMSGEPIKNAKKAVDGFLSQCNAGETSIAIYPLCADPKELTCKFYALALYKETLEATGGTPLYGRLITAIENENMTRAIVFSDGEPTDKWGDKPEKCISIYTEKKIPIDTIFIGEGDSKALQELSEKTGGIYMNFKDTKTLASNLKYLSPGLRGMLMNEDIKARIERGEVI